VGGGNQEPSLRREADQINARAGRKAIVMTGSRTDIARLIRQCDVFVGVSRAALEAISCGKPAILAGNEGYIGTLTPDVLSQAQQSNFCCRGFEPIRGDRLLGDLLHLLSLDAAEREALVRFGRELIETDYSVSKMTQDYLDAYEALLNPKRVIKAAVSGYYGFGNLGDDAILHAISGMFRQFPVPVRLTVLSNSPPDTIRQYRLNAVPRFSPLMLLRTLKESDLLISGGGSLLQNKTSTRSLIYYLAVIRLAQLLHKPVVVYANGIGPLLGSSNRRLVRRAIEKCALVTLRDQQSLEELRSVGVVREDLHVTGDPAFTLKPTHAPRELLRELGIDDDRQVVGISVRELRDNDHFPEQFARLCDRLSLELGKTIVFLVMQESRDEALSRRIMEQMTAPAYLAKTPGDPGAMLSLIRDMDAVVSMRLHTIIFAANVNVPVVGCNYDPKVASMLDILGLPSCGTPADMDADEAFHICTQMLDTLPQQKELLAEKVSEQIQLATHTAQLFEDMLRKNNII
jgi:polysaccharide pyruvyl transferase CsaB